MDQLFVQHNASHYHNNPKVVFWATGREESNVLVARKILAVHNSIFPDEYYLSSQPFVMNYS
jgi:hypothetical protein